MKPAVFYRIAAVLLLLFAAGHTLGFRQTDPSWKVEPALSAMRSIHFDMQGFDRTLWDFFVAAGFTGGGVYVFAAILTWQWGRVPPATLTAWAFAAAFAVIAFLSWRYLFIIPLVFSIAITACLTTAAWLTSRRAKTY